MKKLKILKIKTTLVILISSISLSYSQTYHGNSETTSVFDCQQYYIPELAAIDYTSFDSVARVKYALNHNYQPLFPNFSSNNRLHYYNKFKKYFTAELHGIIDTQKIHLILKRMKDNPLSDTLHFMYTFLTHTVVCKGTILDKQMTLDSANCHPLKTKYQILVDSVIYSSIASISKGDTLLAGTMPGYYGGCNPKNPTGVLTMPGATAYSVGSTVTVALSNVSLLDSHYARLKYRDQKNQSIYFCPFLFRILNIKNISMEDLINIYTNYEW